MPEENKKGSKKESKKGSEEKQEPTKQEGGSKRAYYEWVNDTVGLYLVFAGTMTIIFQGAYGINKLPVLMTWAGIVATLGVKPVKAVFKIVRESGK